MLRYLDHLRIVTIYIEFYSPKEGDKEYEQAYQIGKELGMNGFSIRNGGYCGTMEALSKGIKEIGKTESEGIICSEVFKWRDGGLANKYCTKTTDSTSLLNRIEKMIESSSMFLILPGSLGTLEEFICTLTHEYVRHDKHPTPCIVAFRNPWEKAINGLADSLPMPEKLLKSIKYVDNISEIITIFNDYVNFQK